jgi:hypothetical protein
MAYATNRADEIYTTGPEIVTAHAEGIIAGPVSAYSREVLSTSEPPGPDAIPLQWTVSGRVDNPVALKGPATGSVSFTRAEGSILIADTLEIPSWERAYGDVHPTGQVVLFLGDDPAKPLLVVPSGEGELDLLSLVRDVVAIQTRPPGAQLDAWLTFLDASKTASGREAALRSLVHMNADWKRVRPGLDRLLANHLLDDRMRAFAVGIVVFGLTKNKWAQDQAPVAEFLGRQLATARSPSLALQYVLQMKLALRYAMEEAARDARAPVRTQIVAALLRNESALSTSPQVAEQYRQIRAAYPGLL